MSEAIRIAASDGYALSAKLYGAKESGPVVVINGATGVRQKYYARFSEWLVHRGATVITWDYRGIGESRPHRLRGFTGTMSDWGKHDFEGVLRFATEKFAGREVVVVGHSIGGQILGQARSNRNIARAVTVGSQFGSWQLWPGYKKWAMAGLWHVLMPGVTHVMGRFPGSLGIGADLPRNVALEWAKWGRSRDFFLAHGVSRDGYAAVDAPILSFSLTDDDYAPKAAVDALHSLYVNASVERRHVSPEDVGVSSIGHFGFFRDQFASSLWEQVRAFVSREQGTAPRA
ncbi:MAG: alpha/beta fold hydrolase [Archangium sp.]|nr:alpha/beta fold hydrolase [Archangium sp.]